MDIALAGIIGIAILLLVLFISGMPVGFAMGIVGFCGFWYVMLWALWASAAFGT